MADTKDHDVSSGLIADPRSLVEKTLPKDILSKYEVYSYRNAASILHKSYPDHFSEICDVLRKLTISSIDIRTPGGSKGPIAKKVDTLFSDQWQETRITGDLHVKLLSAKGNKLLNDYTREGYLDGHRIDFVKGRIAFDLEWNSKDQTYDRDLYAFSAFYDA